MQIIILNNNVNDNDNNRGVIDNNINLEDIERKINENINRINIF